MAIHVHERLGDFEIIRPLGKGGMGEVYEARQFNPERRVALKVLAPWLSDDKDSLDRFLKEAKVPANLDHPGIVRIITTGQANGVAYYTMQLVRGISLSEMIRRSATAPNSDQPTRSVEAGRTPSVAGRMDTDQPPASPPPVPDGEPPMVKAYRSDRFMTVARIGAQAARALAFAHDQHVLHRDIKPSNLMVDFHNFVYLVDFGLTRALEQTAADSTQPGTLIGTPWYMSPEQAEGKPLDARSDIYSLGVTLYELTTQGMGPFTASRDNKQSVLAEVRAGQTLPLRMLAPGISAALEQAILKAMHLKPTKRYAHAAELARDLEAICGHSAEFSPHPAPGPRSILKPTRGRWPLLIGGVTVALLAIVLATVAMTWRRDPDRAVYPERKLDGSKALPAALGEKSNLGVKVSLLDAVGAPRWSEYLYGSKKVAPAGDRKFALSADTILALADPDAANYELSIVLNGASPDADFGVFFGWRRREEYSTAPHRIFLIQYKPHLDLEGEVTLGTAGIIKGNDKITESVQGWLGLLPAGKNRLTLPSRNTAVKMYLNLRVQGDDVLVTVPLRAPMGFSLSQLKRDNPGRYQDWSTVGAVGVWCKQGVAIIEDATVTPVGN